MGNSGILDGVDVTPLESFMGVAERGKEMSSIAGRGHADV